MMYSVLLRIIASYLLPVFLFFSLITFYRGHNAPGGGFIGGLLAALAFILYAISYNHQTARQKLRLSPVTLISVGLSLALISGLLSLVLAYPFFKGLWVHFHVPLMGQLHVGTPMLFDFGVFLTVMGITVGIVFTLLGEE